MTSTQLVDTNTRLTLAETKLSVTDTKLTEAQTKASLAEAKLTEANTLIANLMEKQKKDRDELTTAKEQITQMDKN